MKLVCTRPNIVWIVFLFTAAVWGICAFRAVEFYDWAKSYWDETQSVDAWNDYCLSLAILKGYGSTLAVIGVAFLFTWWFRVWALLAPVLLLVLSGLDAIISRPVTPIHLFPTFSRDALLDLNLFAVLIGLTLLGIELTARIHLKRHPPDPAASR